jgi:hypothetical protein
MKRLFAALSVFAVAACATLVDHQTQVVTLRTPGAQNAKCVLENVDMKYTVYTDESFEIMKSPHDLVVHCMAPGNRDQTVWVKREVNDWVFVNVVNGFVPGASYDYFSRGAFEYPDEIVVSFVGVPVSEYPLPQHLNDDLNHNNIYNRPNYLGPGEVITQESRFKQNYELQKRERNFTSDLGPSRNGTGQGGDALDSIHRQYNPTVGYDPSEEDK